MQSQKRTACNECRQQKLRCDLTTTENPSCSRCQKLRLECKLEPAFQRSRKRKRTVDLEDEIHSLRERLADAENAETHTPAPSKYRTPSDTADAAGQPTAHANGHLTVLNGAVARSPEHNNLPGITTRPHDYELQPPTIAPVDGPQDRRLDNVELSEDDIADLFASYFAHYHEFLPVLDPQQPPHKTYELSPVLFWCIVSVAARRSEEHPLLLNQLAQPVMDVLWKNIRIPPHNLGLIQAILLLCTWPFPTSSSTMDQSYMLTSIAISASIQMGLHRPINQHDYVKYRFHLTDQEVNRRINTWSACNVIAHNVSVGVGLQSPSRLEDCPNTHGLPPSLPIGAPDAILSMLQIERFKHRVSTAFTANMTNRLLLRPTEDRLPFYTTLSEDVTALRANVGAVSGYVELQLIAAQLHLEAFFLSDEPSIRAYEDHILSLHSTVIRFMQQVLEMDAKDSLTRYAPFFIYQLLSSACFILLKVLRNDYFSAFIDISVSKKLFNRSISAMRRMSVSNNDIPGRVSDVLAYLYNLSDPVIIGGQGQGGLQIQIRSRLSLSVVYDSLWKWRDQFRAAATGTETQDDIGAGVEAEDDFDGDAFLQFADMPADDLFWDWFR